MARLAHSLASLGIHHPIAIAFLYLSILSGGMLAAAPEIALEEPSIKTLETGTVSAFGSNSNGQTNIPAGALSGVIAIASGEYHTLALRGDQTLLAWGSSFYSQTTVPPALQGRTLAIAAGGYHSLALDIDGKVTAWGSNGSGQLSVPVGLTNVKSIAAGTYHSVALKTDGTIVGWGSNNSGQQSPPTGLTDVRAIAASGEHTLALMANGRVAAWGSDFYGESTVPAELSDVKAIAAGRWASLALKTDGTVVAWGNSSYGGEAPSGLSDVIAISAGTFEAMALKGDGSVVTWGSLSSGYSNFPPAFFGVKAVSAGFSFSTFLSDSHVSFGRLEFGATSSPKSIIIRNTGDSALHLSEISLTGGDASRFTLNTSGSANSLLPGESTSVSITFTASAFGVSHTVLRVLNDDPDEAVHDTFLTGMVVPEIAVFTGSNIDSANERIDNTGPFVFPDTALGTPSSPQVFTIHNAGTDDLTGITISTTGTNVSDFQASQPVLSVLAPGASTTFSVIFTPSAILERSTTLSISSNDLDENPFEIPITGKDIAPDISVEDSNGNLLEGGRLVVWGANDKGQSTLPPLARYAMKQAALGNWHGMGIRNDGTLIGWGLGHNNEPNPPQGIGIVKAIAAGRSYNVAIKQDNSLQAWGSNFQGQTTATGITNVKEVSAGVEHGIYLKPDGTVGSWGYGYAASGVSGLSGANVKAVTAGYYHSLALRTDGTVFFRGRSMMNTLVTYQVSGLSNITAISAGDGYSLALKADGTVWHWNNNVTPTMLPVTGAIAISAGASHYAILKDDRTVLAFGSNAQGQTNVPAGLSSVAFIKATEYNTAAIIAGRVEFGNQAIGSRSPAKTLVLKNTGSAPLHITWLPLISGHTADFKTDTTSMLNTVPVGGQTSIAVSFSPTAGGTREAMLRVASDDPDENYYEITLAGSARQEISVFNNASTDPAHECQNRIGTEEFTGTTVNVTGTTRTFTIRNGGGTNLTGLAVSVTGTDAADFTVSQPLSTSISYGQSTTFTATFRPTAMGPRFATLNIASNDEDENPFEVSVSGTGLSEIEAWRLGYFGNPASSGGHADLADFDHDGLSNLLEYAFGTDPTANTLPADRPQGGVDSGHFTLTYQRPAGGAAGISYSIELSDTDPSAWTTGVSGADYLQTIDSNDDGTETVTITLTGTSQQRRFVRVRVTH